MKRQYTYSEVQYLNELKRRLYSDYQELDRVTNLLTTESEAYSIESKFTDAVGSIQAIEAKCQYIRQQIRQLIEREQPAPPGWASVETSVGEQG